MTQKAFEQLQKEYQLAIAHFLQKKKESLVKKADTNSAFYDAIYHKITAVEEAVATIFKIEEKPEIPLTDTVQPITKKQAIPSVIYSEKEKPDGAILTEKLNIGIFLTVKKEEQALSIPISYFKKKSAEDIATFLSIYGKNIAVGFGLSYHDNRPWNPGEQDNTFEFESRCIGGWFKGIKELLQGKKKVDIRYWGNSNAYIQRLDAKYILLEDPGFAPLIQVTLDDFLPTFLTACIPYLSFLNVVEPIIKRLLKEDKKVLSPSIIEDLDISNFRKRVRHLRRNLYSSSSF